GIVDPAVAEGEPRAVVALPRAVAPHRFRGAAEQVEETVDHALERGERAVASMEEDGEASVAIPRLAELRGGEVEGVVPADPPPAAGAAAQRMGDPLGAVLAVREEPVDLAAEGAAGEGVIGIAADPDDAIAVDLRHHAARVEAVERASRLDDAEHQGQ